MKILVIILILLSSSAYAETKGHNHHGAENQKLSLNKGKKWMTDASLRKNMDSIHAELKKNLTPIHNKKFTPEQFKAFGTLVESNVKDIFQSCKLPPKADAQLHILLVDIMKSMETFKVKNTQDKYHDATVKLLSAVQNYEKYFDTKPTKANNKNKKHKKKK